MLGQFGGPGGSVIEVRVEMDGPLGRMVLFHLSHSYITDEERADSKGGERKKATVNNNNNAVRYGHGMGGYTSPNVYFYSWTIATPRMWYTRLAMQGPRIDFIYPPES